MDPIFEEEQQHLTSTYEKLLRIEQDVRAQLDADLAEALEDKEDMFDEMTRDFAADIQLETLAELEAMNRIIESYNLSADINTEKLRRAQLLLKKPYFAKVRLQFPKGEASKDIYIGAAGMTDEVRRHLSSIGAVRLPRCTTTNRMGQPRTKRTDGLSKLICSCAGSSISTRTNCMPISTRPLQ